MRTPDAIASYKLPPLILHPFADAAGPSKLLESSRANLILRGLLPATESDAEALERRVLEGRYCEIKMLFYVGKDVRRWIEQCLEFVARQSELRDEAITWASLATFLIRHTPSAVRDKLQRWGVGDYQAIFTRGLGLTAVFSDVPSPVVLTGDFIRSYYRFADAMFGCVDEGGGADLESLGFEFELYASGEYALMLEREWESQDEPD